MYQSESLLLPLSNMRFKFVTDVDSCMVLFSVVLHILSITVVRSIDAWGCKVRFTSGFHLSTAVERGLQDENEGLKFMIMFAIDFM